jgi:hypothetical protein
MMSNLPVWQINTDIHVGEIIQNENWKTVVCG